MDEERDEDAGGNRERGQDDADGGQDSLVEAGLKTGFHGVHTRVGLLEAELHGEEQAIEGAVVLVLGDEAVNRPDRPQSRSQWRRGQERRLDGACRSNGGMLIAMRGVYLKSEGRRKS